MLEKNKFNRLVQIGIIKKHRWFQEFDWEKLISLNIIPDYIPKLNDNRKINNINSLNYVDYVKVRIIIPTLQNNTNLWEPEENIEISEEQRQINEVIYANF